MRALLSRERLTRLFGFASAQIAVQVLGFVSGIVLVRRMEPAQYGYYTLAITMVGVANVLTELGVANAVMAIGGRLAGQGGALAGLVGDARALHRRLASIGLCLVLPAFAVLMLHQHAAVSQVVLLAALGGACAVLNVRNSIVLSVARLAGHLAWQQKIDLALNAARLLLLMIVATVALDATIASLLNLGVAAGAFVAWNAYLARRIGTAATARGEHRRLLRDYVARQAPNCVYYVFSSQLAVWMIGIFGTADRVADVGALGRLGAGFAVVTAVIGAVVQPYFARHHASAELESAFIGLNTFFAAVVAVLVGIATFFPGPILWILGPHYAALRAELVWMLLATALSAWGGSLYTVGCGRGWVLPGTLGIGCGVLSMLVGLRCFDLSTVVGNFKLNTLTAGVAVAINVGYVGLRLMRHRRAPSATLTAEPP